VIVMSIDDLLGEDVDAALDGMLVVFNASAEETTQTVAALAGRDYALSAVQAAGTDTVVKQSSWDAASGTVTVPARTVAVLVDATEEPTVTPTPTPTTTPTTEPTAAPTATPTGEPTPTPSTPPGGGSGAAAISLSAASIAAGSTLTVQGSGFTPGETVQLWLHSTPRLLVATTADTSGTVSISATIPADVEPGEHTLRLLGIASGLEASSTITVTAATGAGLSSTGVAVAGWLGLAALLLAAGAGFWLRARRLG
jgi:cobalamin biosynthesis Mg chelatase CobN